MPAAELTATKPEDLGIDSEKLEAVFARAKRDANDGTLKSAQVAVARHGRLAGVRTLARFATTVAKKRFRHERHPVLRFSAARRPSSALPFGRSARTAC